MNINILYQLAKIILSFSFKHIKLNYLTCGGRYVIEYVAPNFLWLQKKSNNAGKERLRVNINPFIVNVTFVYPLKTSESCKDDLFTHILF